MGCPNQFPSLVRTRTATVYTVADLRLLNLSVQPEIARTLGCLSAGDGGGGFWRWDPNSSDPDDTGLTVTPVSPSGPGRWKRVFNREPLNVLWFGAEEGANSGGDLGAIIKHIHDNVLKFYGDTVLRSIYVPSGLWEWRTSCVIQDPVGGLEIFGNGGHGTVQNRGLLDYQSGAVINLVADLGTENPMLAFRSTFVSSSAGVKVHDLNFYDEGYHSGTGSGSVRNYTTSTAIEHDGPAQSRYYNLKFEGLTGSALAVGAAVQCTFENINAMRCGSNGHPTLHFIRETNANNNYTQACVFSNLHLEMCYGKWAIAQVDAAAGNRVLVSVVFKGIKMESVGDRSPNDELNDGWLKIVSGQELEFYNVNTNTTYSTNPANLPRVHIDGVTNLLFSDCTFDVAPLQDAAVNVRIENCFDVTLRRIRPDQFVTTMTNSQLPFAIELVNNRELRVYDCDLGREGMYVKGDYCIIENVHTDGTNQTSSLLEIVGNGNLIRGCRFVRRAELGSTFSHPYLKITGYSNVVSDSMFGPGVLPQIDESSINVVEIDGRDNSLNNLSFSDNKLRPTNSIIKILSGTGIQIIGCSFGSQFRCPAILFDPTDKTSGTSYPGGIISGCYFYQSPGIAQNSLILYKSMVNPPTNYNNMRGLTVVGNSKDGTQLEPPLCEIEPCQSDPTKLPVMISYGVNNSKSGLKVPDNVADPEWQLRIDSSQFESADDYIGATHPFISKRRIYADNAAAKAAGLVNGSVYSTAAGELRMVVP